MYRNSHTKERAKKNNTISLLCQFVERQMDEIAKKKSRKYKTFKVRFDQNAYQIVKKNYSLRIIEHKIRYESEHLIAEK